ncbi:MAG: hypothetical protein IKC05_06750, partial [Lentisphaeria bacterium]|nr:hypothetical protein [Lentisphaeria bacterium]
MLLPFQYPRKISYSLKKTVCKYFLLFRFRKDTGGGGRRKKSLLLKKEPFSNRSFSSLFHFRQPPGAAVNLSDLPRSIPLIRIEVPGPLNSPVYNLTVYNITLFRQKVK